MASIGAVQLAGRDIGAAQSTPATGDVALPAADDFGTGGDATLDGATMSDTTHTWALDHDGGWSRSSGVAVCDATDGAQYCDNMPDTADIEVSAVAKVGKNGVTARRTAGENYYYLRAEIGAALSLFKRVNSTWTAIGTGANVSADDAYTLRCYNDTIYGLLNGSIEITATSQSDHATGKAGMRGAASADALDTWAAAVYTPAAGGAFTEHYYRHLLAGVSR